MKKNLFILFTALSLMGAGSWASAQAAKTVTLDIKGMTCAMCGAKIENSLKKLEGVQKCSVDNKTGKGTVEYTEGKVTPDQIVEACNKTGFKCSM